MSGYILLASESTGLHLCDEPSPKRSAQESQRPCRSYYVCGSAARHYQWNAGRVCLRPSSCLNLDENKWVAASPLKSCHANWKNRQN